MTFIIRKHDRSYRQKCTCADSRVLCYFYGFEPKLDEGALTNVYSLPGNGEAQEVSTPSSPKRNARKVAREGRVLVETGSNTNTLQGQEVK